MELDLQILFGLHVHSCTVYSRLCNCSEHLHNETGKYTCTVRVPLLVWKQFVD
jgi:hypothetical protein